MNTESTVNTTTNQSLLDIVDNVDNVARIAALRGIVHSSMAKAIGAIRQHIRDRARDERDEDEPQIDLDQRNHLDENARSVDQIASAMGFDVRTPPLQQASLWHAVYDWAQSDLRTLAVSRWDAPLSLEQMLEFMTKGTPKLDPTLAKALADAAKTNVETIERMHELQSQREREQLVEATPEILTTFRGFGDNGYADAIDDLPKIDQHQLGVKVAESLNKARDQVLARVLRTRRIADLASIPLIEDAATQVGDWVESFERRYSEELDEAIEAGRNVRTLEDVVTL